MSGDINERVADLQRRLIDDEAKVSDKRVAAVLSELRVILVHTEYLPDSDAKGGLVNALEDALNCVERLPGSA